jgi:Periplasmic binding protein domain
VQGALSAAASAYTLKGVENILAKHPEIKVVSSQAADWDAAKAKAIVQTVLKQNPDLCGIVGFWDGMDIGDAAAVKEAGLTGKVFVATLGRRRAQGLLRTRQERRLRSRPQLRRADPGRRHGGADQVFDLLRRQTEHGQGSGLHDPGAHHQRHGEYSVHLLESQRLQEIAETR